MSQNSTLDRLNNPSLETQAWYGDKLLPTQEFMRGLYNGTDYERTLRAWIAGFSIGFETGKFKLQSELSSGVGIPIEQLSSTPMMVGLLVTLAKLIKAKLVLEVGTFMGTTTMHLARVVDCVVTVERGMEFAEIAKKNFVDNGFSNITLLTGEALDVLQTIGGKADMIFIDGGKEEYLPIAQQCERLLRGGGLMVIDDVFFHGDAMNWSPQTDKGRGCRELLEHYIQRPDMLHLLLPIGNGVLLLIKAA